MYVSLCTYTYVCMYVCIYLKYVYNTNSMWYVALGYIV